MKPDKKNQVISFDIESLDPLGQGVSKQNGQISFIPKTLPGEKVQAIIRKRSKGVQFAQLLEVEKPSKIRILPSCAHYDQCQGCSYLHTSYPEELSFKAHSLMEQLRRIGNLSTELKPFISASSNRFSYRTRVQLHYNLKRNLLGFQSRNSIITVPNCLLPTQEIKEKIVSLYKENSWRALLKDAPNEGHIVVYELEKGVEIKISGEYSPDGFTQVNREINDKLVKIVEEKAGLVMSKTDSFIEFFAGAGNLTNKITGKGVLLDSYPTKKVQKTNLRSFVQADLEEMQPFKTAEQIKLFIIDPPRKGFSMISDWAKEHRPEKIIYVSCNPGTLARDLKKIPNYKIQEIYLLDMFPGTKHFESVVVLDLQG